MELNLSPSPVSVTTPTINPAAAQVAATFNTPIEPPSMALRRPEFQMPGITGSLRVNTS